MTMFQTPDPEENLGCSWRMLPVLRTFLKSGVCVCLCVCFCVLLVCEFVFVYMCVCVCMCLFVSNNANNLPALS